MMATTRRTRMRVPGGRQGAEIALTVAVVLLLVLLWLIPNTLRTWGS